MKAVKCFDSLAISSSQYPQIASNVLEYLASSNESMQLSILGIVYESLLVNSFRSLVSTQNRFVLPDLGTNKTGIAFSDSDGSI